MDAAGLPYTNTPIMSHLFIRASSKLDDSRHLECTTERPVKNPDLNGHAHPAHINLAIRTLLNGGVSLCGTQRADALAGLSFFVPTCFSSVLALTAVSFNEIRLH